MNETDATAQSAAPQPAPQPAPPPTAQSAPTSAPAPNPFVETAMATAKLVDMLRQNPDALEFLTALLACLKPAEATQETPQNPPPQNA